MITVKDFAREQGCGESIVYRHIRNHREELGERIQKAHGRTWITPEGVTFIKNLMTQQMVIEEKAAPEVKSLQKQIKEQEITIKMQESIIEALKLKFEDLQAEKLRLTEGMEQKLIEAVQEATEAQKTALDELWAQEVEKVRSEAQTAAQAAIKAKEDELHLKHQRELQEEQNRAISFKEWWTRRKKGKKNESNN